MSMIDTHYQRLAFGPEMFTLDKNIQREKLTIKK